MMDNSAKNTKSAPMTLEDRFPRDQYPTLHSEQDLLDGLKVATDPAQPPDPKLMELLDAKMASSKESSEVK